MMYLGVVFFVSILIGSVCASGTCKSISYAKFGVFSFIIFQRSVQFLPFFLLLEPYDLGVGRSEALPEAP